MNRAVVDLIKDDRLGDDEMVRLAANQILNPKDRENLEPLTISASQSEGESIDTNMRCKKCGHPAKMGNYGFCGYHR